MTNEALEKYISEMSDEELCGAVLSWEFNSDTSNEELEKFVKENYVSSFFANNFTREQVDFVRGAIKRHVKSPCFITADIEAGPIFFPELTPLVPRMMNYGATDNEQLVYEIGKYTARLSRGIGIHATLAPVVDINYNFNNPVVNTRAASDSAERVSRIAGAYACGIQSENKLIATAKHFPGDGLDDRNQHFCTTVNTFSREEWDATYGKVYKEMIDSGVEAIMVAHIALPCYDDTRDELGYLPATLSERLMTGLLKGKLGFDGCIISDAMSMIGTATRMPIKELAVQFLRAGGDLVLFPEKDDFKRVLAALRSGELSRERLVDAVRRVLKLKNKLGLFECDTCEYAPEDVEKLKEMLLKVGEQSVTLIRNIDGVLPLKLKQGSKVLTVTLTLDPYFRKKEDPLSEFSDELQRRGIEVIRMTDPKHYAIDEVINTVDAAFLLINVDSINSPGNSMRLGWSNMMSMWRAYLFKNKNVACISFGDPYKLYELPFLKTYVNAYSPDSASMRAAIRACLGEIGFEGKSPVGLKDFFDRED